MRESNPSTTDERAGAVRPAGLPIADIFVGAGILLVAGGAAAFHPAAAVIVIGVSLVVIGARSGAG